MLCIQNGMVHDAIHPQPRRADILVENGKIVRIAADLTPPDGCQVVNAAGRQVYPGFVEAHSHLGLDVSGAGAEGEDYSEFQDIFSPQLRSIDAIQPMDPAFREAALAGVTTVCTGPGSCNVLGGQFAAIKTVGRRVDDMVVRANVAMKCAFGENPKRRYKNINNSSRMSTAAKLRDALFRARDYQERIEAAGDDLLRRPPFDMKLESLLPVLRREIPLKAHAHQANDCFTALRIAREFGVDITLEHVTEGHLVADLLAKENVPLAVGPSLTHASKIELRNKTFETPGILAKAGCQVSIITDAPVIPQCYLSLCAALAVKSGMEPFAALQAITINPAHHIGVADRLGSLEAGKDADIVMMDGPCFAIDSTVEMVFINGQPVR